MTLILYCKCHYYVPSFHPVFFDELYKHVDANLILMDVSQKQSKEVRAEIDKADLVVLDQSIYIGMNYSINKDAFNVIVLNNRRSNDHYKFVWEYALASKKRILYLATFSDLHAISGTREHDGLGPEFESFINRIDGIAWAFFYGSTQRALIPHQYKDQWMENYDDPWDVWQKVRSRVETTIDLQHCVHSSEILTTSKPKKWQIAVVGHLYSTRKIALRAAENENLIIAQYGKLKNLVEKPSNLLLKIGFRDSSIILKMKMMKHFQDYILSRSFVSFACGSGYGYVIRKFFEIPSKKSILMCYPAIGLTNYGFVNEVSCITTDPENVGKETKFLLSRPQVVRSLLENATKTLLSLHTTEKRAKQFISAVSSMEKNGLKEAKFVSGEFKLFK